MNHQSTRTAPTCQGCQGQRCDGCTVYEQELRDRVQALESELAKANACLRCLAKMGRGKDGGCLGCVPEIG